MLRATQKATSKDIINSIAPPVSIESLADIFQAQGGNQPLLLRAVFHPASSQLDSMRLDFSPTKTSRGIRRRGANP